MLLVAMARCGRGRGLRLPHLRRNTRSRGGRFGSRPLHDLAGFDPGGEHFRSVIPRGPNPGGVCDTEPDGGALILDFAILGGVGPTRRSPQAKFLGW